MADSLQVVEETVKRITSNKGVIGYCIVNTQGIPIRSDLDDEVKVKYASLITQLVNKANDAVRKLDGGNDLTFFRMRTKMHEILVAPEREYIMFVVQNVDLGAPQGSSGD